MQISVAVTADIQQAGYEADKVKHINSVISNSVTYHLKMQFCKSKKKEKKKKKIKRCSTAVLNPHRPELFLGWLTVSLKGHSSFDSGEP